jgi:hypothetical protein
MGNRVLGLIQGAGEGEALLGNLRSLGRNIALALGRELASKRREFVSLPKPRTHALSLPSIGGG